MKKIGTVIIILILIVILAGIGFVAYGYYRKATMEVKNPVATMEVEGFGTVKMELYPDQAPNTVINFIKLANRKFYDGLTFHRIIKDFMIQGGDNSEDGSGSGAATLKDLYDEGTEDAYAIQGEFTSNNIKNTLKFEEGTLAMARSDYTSYSSELLTESYNSATSQFFIMTNRNVRLNGNYAGFGKVIEGMDVVKKIAEVEVTQNDKTQEGEEAEMSKPVNPPKITSIRVETYGIDYGDPITMDPFDYITWMYDKYGIDPSTITDTQTTE